MSPQVNNGEDDERRWMMEDELSPPLGEFIFLLRFSQLTNCYISAKHTKLSTMATGEASQTTPVQSTPKLRMCDFDSAQFV